MKIINITVLFVLLIFSTISIFAEDVIIDIENYKTEEVKGIVFKWQIIENSLYINISAPTSGWVAVGFDPSRMMKDANILIGYVKDGKTYMEDHFGAGKIKHKADIDLGGSDDITIISGSEEEDKTTLEFSIPLNSWDSNDRRLEEGKEYKVIFAFGKKDDFTSYHKLRTSLMITL